ncbi:MAG: uroporphyrinogen decarboxylase [Ferrimicrobium sp.]
MQPHTLNSTSPLISALNRQKTSHTPVWFMRQAGRSLPEYRKIRGVESILQVLKHPELAAEITVQPVRRYGVDAAIIYSDIMAPLDPLNIGLDIKPGIGPVVNPPFRTLADLDRMRSLEAEDDLASMAQALELVRREVSVPIIGFAGAPFTIASYLIEGNPSRSYENTKFLMVTNPLFWDRLINRLVDIIADTLALQVAHGATVLQLFDSWVGALSPAHYRRYLLPHMRELTERVSSLGVPLIHFGINTGSLLDTVAELSIAALGVDWRVDLGEVAARFGDRLAIQGNLDPVLALAPTDVLLGEVDSILRHSARAPGYIFNLGHGVLPTTDPAQLRAITDYVHDYGEPIRSQVLQESQ